MKITFELPQATWVALNTRKCHTAAETQENRETQTSHPFTFTQQLRDTCWKCLLADEQGAEG